ncbi:unnamed protein product [Rhizophagus irregularis]|nr:unnamed protein product [Rhizophagus irregularis]
MEEVLIDPLEHTAKLRKNLISEVYNKYRFSVDECSHEAKGGFGIVYTAEWINGNITDWNKNRQQFLRSGTKTTILKSLNNSHDPSEYFFREKPTSIYI